MLAAVECRPISAIELIAASLKRYSPSREARVEVCISAIDLHRGLIEAAIQFLLNVTFTRFRDQLHRGLIEARRGCRSVTYHISAIDLIAASLKPEAVE